MLKKIELLVYHTTEWTSASKKRNFLSFYKTIVRVPPALKFIFLILPVECIYRFHFALSIKSDCFTNTINRLIFVIEIRRVFLKVGTKYLNIIFELHRLENINGMGGVIKD